MITKLILTLVVAVGGAALGKKIKMPAGYMTGSMIVVIIFNYITDMAYCPTVAKPYVQLIAGAFIAFGITKSTILDMKKIVKPLVAYISVLFVWALLCGFIMYRVGGLEKTTAFLSCVPGGLTDISLISIDMGANTPQVTVLQTLRMTMAVGLFPVLTKLYVRRVGDGECENTDKSEVNASAKKEYNPKTMIITFVVACAGGVIGTVLGFPAATLTGAMISTAIYNIFTNQAYLPVEFRRITQVVAGAMIGAMVTRADIQSLSTLIIPFCIILFEYVVMDFVIAPWLSKLFHLDLLTMILACTPAGAADMALIAGDMGGDMSDVAVFHVVRLCAVVTVFPVVIQQIVRFL